jgi:hypothetical protein
MLSGKSERIRIAIVPLQKLSGLHYRQMGFYSNCNRTLIRRSRMFARIIGGVPVPSER